MKRLTPQDIAGIKILYKKGWSTVKLGKKYGVCHTTIFYHTKDLKGKLIKRRTEIPPLPDREIPEFIRKNLEERALEELKKKKVEIKKGYCICGEKIKDEKWKLSNFCSLMCYLQN